MLEQFEEKLGPRASAVLFLVVMMSVVTAIALIFSSGDNKFASPLKVQEDTQSKELYAQSVNFDSQPAEVEDNAEVLQAATPDFNPTGCQGGVRFDFQPVCSSTNVTTSLNENSTSQNNQDGTITVRGADIIEVWRITYPGGYLAGPDLSQMNDTELAFYLNREIAPKEYGTTDLTFPAGAEFAGGNQNEKREGSWHYNLSLFAPNSDKQKDFINNVILGPGKKQSHRLNVCIDTGQGCPNPDTTEQPATLNGGTQEDQSLNPAVSGEAANQVGGATLPPHAFSKSRSENPGICTAVNMDEVTTVNQDNYVGCQNRRAPFDIAKAAVVSAEVFAQCASSPNSPQCQKTSLIALKIDAPFGSAYTCNEGFCAIKPLDTAVASMTVPNSDRLKVTGITPNSNEPIVQPYYIKTNCQIRINYGRIQSIPCLWDMSPYQRFCEIAVAENAPGKHISCDNYLEILKKQAEAQNAKI